MRLSKWGNSLAVRIPAATVDELGLKEGDDVKISIFRPNPRVAEIQKMTREEALEALKKFRGMMPEDFKFNRDEANER